MPFETGIELQRLQAAIELPEVAAKPADFAIGTLYGYQSKFEKIRRRAIDAIYKRLKELDPLGAQYQEKMVELNALELAPDLGFYYTIFLFDKLVHLSPNLINGMILSVLSFDTLGNYLLEEQPIVIEVLVTQTVTVILGEILRLRRIDVGALNRVAQQNRKNTIYHPDSTIPVNTVLPEPTGVSLSIKRNWPQLKNSSQEWRDLINRVEDAEAVEVLRKKIAKAPFSFDLISQEATPDNISRFLIMAVQMFNHAKMQDSAKLFTLNAAPYPNAKASKSSTVALLQDTLPSWFVLSLVLASTEDIFNQRLAFIVGVINTATQKKPKLPPNTTADIFLPLFQFATYIFQSILQFHPVVKSSLSHIKEMASKRTPNDITNSIALQIPPMRMVTTSQLILNSEMGCLTSQALSVDKLSQIIVELSLSPENQPLSGENLSRITTELTQIAQGLCLITAELGELNRILTALSLIAKKFSLRTGVAAELSQIASNLIPIAQKLSPIAEVKKIITQGGIIYSYFNREHHMVSEPQQPVLDDVRVVFNQQPKVKELFEDVDFLGMLNLLASTYIVFQLDNSIGRQLCALHYCLDLDSPRIYSLRDKKFFEGSGALDFIARQAQRISNDVSSQDEEYKRAVNEWCATILKACQQALDMAPGQKLAGRGSASSQEGGSRSLLDFFRRTRAISEPPLPKPTLDKATRAAAFKPSVSCPASYFAFSSRRSDTDGTEDVTRCKT